MSPFPTGRGSPGPAADAGTTIPLILVLFVAAGLLTAASVAASAAFLAQRDLAGVCDGAAVAAANAFARPAVGIAPDADALPLGPDRVRAAVDRYRRLRAVAPGDTLEVTAISDGRTVTVTCHRTIRVPFGSLLGEGDGLDRTAVARARSPLEGP